MFIMSFPFYSLTFASLSSYIVTNRGMHAMYEKYRTAAFGRCPHVFCQGQPVLPVGLSDLPRNYTVNVFCPRCHGLFFPKSTRQANIDGAYFGTTFPHLYLMTHPVSETTKSCMGPDVVISPQPCLSGHDTFEANTNLHSSGVRFQGKPTKFILQESRGRSSAPTNREFSKAKSPFKAQTRPEMKGPPS
jgi:hypothetical protein